jgi:hypothetical protein
MGFALVDLQRETRELVVRGVKALERIADGVDEHNRLQRADLIHREVIEP